MLITLQGQNTVKNTSFIEFNTMFNLMSTSIIYVFMLNVDVLLSHNWIYVNSVGLYIVVKAQVTVSQMVTFGHFWCQQLLFSQNWGYIIVNSLSTLMSYMKHAYFGVQMFSKSVKIRFSKTLYSIGYSNGTNMSNSNENRSLFNDENEVPNDSFLIIPTSILAI